jgi:uncharacterized protein (TIGR02996 family)
MRVEDWYQELEKTPVDWNLRLVFADWLADQGLTKLEYGQRWQARHHKAPREYSIFPTVAMVKNLWGLGTELIETPEFRTVPEMLLPAEVFTRVVDGVYDHNSDRWRYFKTQVEAETQLAEALARCKETR